MQYLHVVYGYKNDHIGADNHIYIYNHHVYLVIVVFKYPDSHNNIFVMYILERNALIIAACLPEEAIRCILT